MPEGYSTHRDYMGKVQEDVTARQANIEIALRVAFAGFIEKREVETVVFTSMTVLDLAKAIQDQSTVLKALLAVCSIGGRALSRDLGLNIDTYEPRLTDETAAAVAGYIKPFLPPYLELPALSYIDRLHYIDKEIRKGKGRWEKLVRWAADQYGSPRKFKKIKFKVGDDEFELDSASRTVAGTIDVGIDVKRIEARQDIHKRCDEIVNKAAKLKEVAPDAKFGAVIYYPFIEEQINVQNRLKSPHIDGIVFASESADSVNNGVRLLLSSMGIGTPGEGEQEVMEEPDSETGLADADSEE